MNKLLTSVYKKAKDEGRTCQRCGWIVTKKDYAVGHLLCAGCRDALKGVNVPPRWGMWRDEPIDKTGEML